MKRSALLAAIALPFVFGLFAQPTKIAMPTNRFKNMHYTQTFDPQDLRYTKGGGYEAVTMQGLELNDVVGAPQLPVKYISFIIPAGMDVNSIRVTKTVDYLFPPPPVILDKLSRPGLSKTKKGAGKFNLASVQPPVIPSEDWTPGPFVKPDPAYYSLKRYPASQVQVSCHGYFDGNARIVTFAVYPITYYPADQQLVFSRSISFKFNFIATEKKEKAIQTKKSYMRPIFPAYRSAVLQQKYDELLINMVVNPQLIDKFYVRPEVVFVDKGGNIRQPGAMLLKKESLINPVVNKVVDLKLPIDAAPPKQLEKVDIPALTGKFSSAPPVSYADPLLAPPASNGDLRRHSLEMTNITADDRVSPVADNYVIIAPAELMEYFEQFRQWKQAKGLNVYTRTLESIYADPAFAGGDKVQSTPAYWINDNAGRVRQYLCEQYLQNGLVYALLVGDETNGPFRQGCSAINATLADNQVPADLYFSDFNGDWNQDGDAHLGEPKSSAQATQTGDNPDYFNEIYVGRLLVRPLAEGGDLDILNWTHKLIAYESDPGAGDPSYLRGALYTKSDFTSSFPGINDQLSLLRGKQFPLEVIDEADPLYGSLGEFPNGRKVVESLNRGYGLTSFNNHGTCCTIAVATNGDNGYPKYWVFSLDDYFSTNQINENGNGLDMLSDQTLAKKYFINYSISCDIGAYDEEALWGGRYCMARVFTSYTDGKTMLHRGGPAMICNTRYGTIDSSVLLKKFVQNLFADQPVTNIGIALAGAKFGLPVSMLKHHAYSMTLFGDPEMPVWTNLPKTLLAEHNFSGRGVTVKDERQAIVKGVKVHFWNAANGASGLAFTNENGYAACPSEVGAYTNVCLSKINYRPLKQKIQTGNDGRPVAVDDTPQQREEQQVE